MDWVAPPPWNTQSIDDFKFKIYSLNEMLSDNSRNFLIPDSSSCALLRWPFIFVM